MKSKGMWLLAGALSLYSPVLLAEPGLQEKLQAWIDENVDLSKLEQWVNELRAGDFSSLNPDINPEDGQKKIEELFNQGMDLDQLKQSFSELMPSGQSELSPEEAQRRIEQMVEQNLNWDSLDWDQVTAPMNGYFESVLSEDEIAGMKELLNSMKGSTQAERSENLSKALSEKVRSRIEQSGS